MEGQVDQDGIIAHPERIARLQQELAPLAAAANSNFRAGRSSRAGQTIEGAEHGSDDSELEISPTRITSSW